jgi:hypothetical protein
VKEILPKLEIDEKLRFTLDLKHKSDWINENLRIRNRIRYQHSSIISGASKDYIRYRLALDCRFNEDVRPYLALEPYQAVDDLEFARVRLYLGANLEILKNELNIYFIIEGRERNNALSSNYIMGVSYNF